MLEARQEPVRVDSRNCVNRLMTAKWMIIVSRTGKRFAGMKKESQSTRIMMLHFIMLARNVVFSLAITPLHSSLPVDRDSTPDFAISTLTTQFLFFFYYASHCCANVTLITERIAIEHFQIVRLEE